MLYKHSFTITVTKTCSRTLSRLQDTLPMLAREKCINASFLTYSTKKHQHHSISHCKLKTKQSEAFLIDETEPDAVVLLYWQLIGILLLTTKACWPSFNLATHNLFIRCTRDQCRRHACNIVLEDVHWRLFRLNWKSERSILHGRETGYREMQFRIGHSILLA